MTIRLNSQTIALITATLYFSLAATRRAKADPCSASANASNYHSIQSNKYLFPFDVRASSCTRYACRGYVKFTIRYHFQGDSHSLTDRTLVQYTVERNNSQTHVSTEHWVGPVDASVVIDDVAVEEVSCSTP